MFTFTQKSYSKVPLLDEDKDEDYNEPYPKSISTRAQASQWIKPLLVIIVALVLIGLSTLTTITVLRARSPHCQHHTPGEMHPHVHEQQTEENTPLHCGKSVDEAISLGCTFDPMTLQWLRPECTRTGNQDYLDFLSGNLTYWVDHEGKIPVPDLSRQVNEDGFWGQQRQHVAHCAFMYVRLIEAATTDGVYDRKTWSSHHANHCAHVLLKWAMRAPDMEEAKQWARVSFGTCWQKKNAAISE